MSLIQIGLTDRTGTVDPGTLHAAAAAFNIQTQRDLPPIWQVNASVMVLPDPTKIPTGVWPVFLVNNLPPGEGGVHLDKNHQPYALVEVTPGTDEWTIAASHEIIEMVVDPWGNRIQSSQSIEIVGGRIQDGAGVFQYLVEAADPCEADNYAYSIQGIAVTDFITPNFYDAVVSPGTKYSFTQAIKAPRQILPGGYISWIDPVSDEWQQLQYFDTPKIVDLGPAAGASLREWIDSRTASLSKQSKQSNPHLMSHCAAHRVHLNLAASKRAALYK